MIIFIYFYFRDKMCIADIIEFINDCKNGLSYQNTGTYFYKDGEGFNNFSHHLIVKLREEYSGDATFRIVSVKQFIVEAIIYGKLHTIELEVGNDAWNVSFPEED